MVGLGGRRSFLIGRLDGPFSTALTCHTDTPCYDVLRCAAMDGNAVSLPTE